MDPGIGYAEPRLGPRKRDPLIPNDWSAISGKFIGAPRAIRHQSGRPSSGSLIAAKDSVILAHFLCHHAANLGDPFPALCANKNASFLAHFSPVGYRDVKGADNGISLIAIRYREEGPLIPDDRPAIYGRPLETAEKHTANPGDPLSAP